MPLRNDLLSPPIIQIYHYHRIILCPCNHFKFILNPSFHPLQNRSSFKLNYHNFIQDSFIIPSMCYNNVGERGGGGVCSRYLISTNFHTCHLWLGWPRNNTWMGDLLSPSKLILQSTKARYLALALFTKFMTNYELYLYLYLMPSKP